MFRNRICRVWLTAGTAAALAFTGLSTSARADNPPPGLPESWQQEPRAREGESPAVATRDWTGPGGPADPGDFTLSAGAMNAETSSRVSRLDAVLPKQGVQDLLVAANRTMVPWCTGSDPFGRAPAPDMKYCLDGDDSKSTEWIPQAVTGVSDAKDNELWGQAGNIQMFGSYDGDDPGRHKPGSSVGNCTESDLKASDACNQKGVRVTFSQSRTNPAGGSPEIKYRHVLLAWTYKNSADHISFDGLHASEDPIQKGVHAGGMVWYGNYLYLADTRNGIRVFDMRKIMDLNPDGDATTKDPMGADTDGVRTTADVRTKTKVGRHKNVWYSFGYRYVMPQVAAWKFKATQSNPRSPSFACVSSGAPKASYLSLDRTTVPDRLLMGEYCRPQVGGHPSAHYPSTGRIASYPVAALEQRSGAVAAQGWANYLPLPDGGAQGAAAHNGKLYVNVSRGKNLNGHLHRAAWDKSALTLTGPPMESATGLEDLYVERGSGRLWSISEHGPNTKECGSLCHRVLYAHQLSSVGARR